MSVRSRSVTVNMDVRPVTVIMGMRMIMRVLVMMMVVRIFMRMSMRVQVNVRVFMLAIEESLGTLIKQPDSNTRDRQTG